MGCAFFGTFFGMYLFGMYHCWYLSWGVPLTGCAFFEMYLFGVYLFWVYLSWGVPSMGCAFFGCTFFGMYLFWVYLFWDVLFCVYLIGMCPTVTNHNNSRTVSGTVSGTVNSRKGGLPSAELDLLGLVGRTGFLQVQEAFAPKRQSLQVHHQGHNLYNLRWLGQNKTNMCMADG